MPRKPKKATPVRCEFKLPADVLDALRAYADKNDSTVSRELRRGIRLILGERPSSTNC